MAKGLDDGLQELLGHRVKVAFIGGSNVTEQSRYLVLSQATDAYVFGGGVLIPLANVAYIEHCTARYMGRSLRCHCCEDVE